MKRSRNQHEKGFFVVEGEKAVISLLESNFTIVNALMTEKYCQELKALLERKGAECSFDLFITPESVLEQLTGYKYFQGVLAVGQIPKKIILRDLWQKTSGPRVFLMLDGLANAENVGGIIRTAVALGVQSVICTTECCNPWLRRSVRSSIGNIFKISVLEDVDIQEACSEFRAHGMKLVAAHPHGENQVLGRYDWGKGDVCLLLGNEGQGLSSEILALCDETVSLPMCNGVDSLNVASAAAIFLYDINRRFLGV